MSEPFRVLVADPPWRFSDRLPGRSRGMKRGAASNYPCMPTADICRLVLPPLAPDCVLLLWRVAAMQQDALDVAKAWGFTIKSEMVWIKLTAKGGELGSAKLAFGMGHQVRAAHEVCLIATRGKVRPVNRSTRSVFHAPVGMHSEKPAAFFDIVEKMYEGPRVELFSRRVREGWDCRGFDTGHRLEVAA